MRCKVALQEISKLGRKEDLGLNPLLSDHIRLCPGCAGQWRSNAALLDMLALREEPVRFGDVTPGVMALIDDRRAAAAPRLRWAAAAAIALGALLLGYILGLNGSSAPSGEGQAAAYKEALSGMPSGSVELAALDSNSGGAVTYAAEARK